MLYVVYRMIVTYIVTSLVYCSTQLCHYITITRSRLNATRGAGRESPAPREDIFGFQRTIPPGARDTNPFASRSIDYTTNWTGIGRGTQRQVIKAESPRPPF